jgi:hypothetical protein
VVGAVRLVQPVLVVIVQAIPRGHEAQRAAPAIALEQAPCIGGEDHGPDVLADLHIEVRASTARSNFIPRARELDRIGARAAHGGQDVRSGARCDLYAAIMKIPRAAHLNRAITLARERPGERSDGQHCAPLSDLAHAGSMRACQRESGQPSGPRFPEM